MANTLKSGQAPSILDIDFGDIDWDYVMSQTYERFTDPEKIPPEKIGPALNPERVVHDIISGIGANVTQYDVGPVSDVLKFIDPVVEGAADIIDFGTDVFDEITSGVVPVGGLIGSGLQGEPISIKEAVDLGREYIENGYTIGNLVDFFTADYLKHMIGDQGEIAPLDAVIVGGFAKRLLPGMKKTLEFGKNLLKKGVLGQPKKTVKSKLLGLSDKESELAWSESVIERFFSESSKDLTELKNLYLSDKKFLQFNQHLKDAKFGKEFSRREYDEMINGMFTGEVPSLAVSLVESSASRKPYFSEMAAPVSPKGEYNPLISNPEIGDALVADVRNIVFDIPEGSTAAGWHVPGTTQIHMPKALMEPEFWLNKGRKSWDEMSYQRTVGIHEWTHMIHDKPSRSITSGMYDDLINNFIARTDASATWLEAPSGQLFPNRNWFSIDKIKSMTKKHNIKDFTYVGDEVLQQMWFEMNGAGKIYKNIRKQLRKNEELMRSVHTGIFNEHVFPNLRPSIMPIIEDEVSTLIASRIMHKRIKVDDLFDSRQLLKNSGRRDPMLPIELEKYGASYILGYNHYAIPSQFITENVLKQSKIKFQMILRKNLDYDNMRPMHSWLPDKDGSAGSITGFTDNTKRWHFLEWPVYDIHKGLRWATTNLQKSGGSILTKMPKDYYYDGRVHIQPAPFMAKKKLIPLTKKDINKLSEKEYELSMKFFESELLFTARNEFLAKVNRGPSMHEVMARLSEINLGSLLNPTTPMREGAHGIIGMSASKRLQKYFTKETLENLKDNVWGFSLPLVPLAD